MKLKAGTKLDQKKYISDKHKNVQPKVATKSDQKKYLSDNNKKVQPKVPTKSYRKTTVFSDDDSDDFIAKVLIIVF